MRQFGAGELRLRFFQQHDVILVQALLVHFGQFLRRHLVLEGALLRYAAVLHNRDLAQGHLVVVQRRIVVERRRFVAGVVQQLLKAASQVHLLDGALLSVDGRNDQTEQHQNDHRVPGKAAGPTGLRLGTLGARTVLGLFVHLADALLQLQNARRVLRIGLPGFRVQVAFHLKIQSRRPIVRYLYELRYVVVAEKVRAFLVGRN